MMLNNINQAMARSVGRQSSRLRVLPMKDCQNTPSQVSPSTASLMVVRIPSSSVVYGMLVASSAKISKPHSGLRTRVSATAKPITTKMTLAGGSAQSSTPKRRPNSRAMIFPGSISDTTL